MRGMWHREEKPRDDAVSRATSGSSHQIMKCDTLACSMRVCVFEEEC